MVYMFEGHGNTTFGNETTEMREGMLKFNIEVIELSGQRTMCRDSSQVSCFVISMHCNYNRFPHPRQEFTHVRLTKGEPILGTILCAQQKFHWRSTQ